MLTEEATAGLDSTAEVVLFSGTLDEPANGCCAVPVNGESAYWTTTSTR
ncbi:hypothetical protein ARUL111621_08940 [Arthrobacter ulcerisalmonis]